MLLHAHWTRCSTLSTFLSSGCCFLLINDLYAPRYHFLIKVHYAWLSWNRNPVTYCSTLSGRAVEYAAEGVRHPQYVYWVWYRFGGSVECSSLSLVSGPHWFRVVVSVRIQSMGQVKLFNHLFSISLDIWKHSALYKLFV